MHSHLCQNCEYIIDIHFEQDVTHIFSKNLEGELKHYPLAYHPKIYADFGKMLGDDEAQYLSTAEKKSPESLVAIIASHPLVTSIEPVRKYLSTSDDTPSEVLEISVLSVKHIEKVVEDLKKYRINMYNIDINPRQHFFIDTQSRPLAACHIHAWKKGTIRKHQDGKYTKDYDIDKDLLILDRIEMQEDISQLDYALPVLKIVEVKVDIDQETFPDPSDRIKSIEISESYYQSLYQEYETKLEKVPGKKVLRGNEKHILQDFVQEIEKRNPDILLMAKGDQFMVNYLAYRARANRMAADLVLGRLPISTYPYTSEGQSYMSYGQITHKDTARYIPGRVHLDITNSFFLHDSGYEGLFELSRMSGIPPERVARASIGTVLTGIEMTIAAAQNALIPPARAKTEDFKPAAHLLISDNGGLVYDPTPGLYTGVWAIDFTSLYPFIMYNHNIGSETVLCEHESCAIPQEIQRPHYTALFGKEDKQHSYKNIVPEVRYHICTRRVSVVTRTMELILRKRVQLKALKTSEQTPEGYKKRYKRIDSAMKWILVSCLDGCTRVMIRKNGICSSERLDKVVNEFSQTDNLEALGIDEYGNPEFKAVKGVVKVKPSTPVYQITFKGGKTVKATGDHLWPVFTNDGWKDIRTDQLTSDHRVPQLADGRDNDPMYSEERLIQLNKMERIVDSPTTFSRALSVKPLKEPPEYVYCLQLDSPTPWFMIQGGMITHNCFGYLGFKNARWGRIESHQAVTAYARRYLLEAKIIAERHGYHLLAGIVDSLFLQPTRPELDDQEKVNELIEEIIAKTNIPLDCEGRFQWLVFCNVRDYTNVAALNRYFGLFDYGKFKLRGIRHRQRRVTVMEKEFQEEILQLFRGARTVDEFEQIIPKAATRLEIWKKRLVDRQISPHDLKIKIKSHRGVNNYKATNTHQAIVARLYYYYGKTLEAGQNMLYIVKNDGGKGEERVTIGPEVQEDSRYDFVWYGKMLERAFLELLEAPQLQIYGKIKFDGNPVDESLDEFFLDYVVPETKPEKKEVKLVATRKEDPSLDDFF